MIERHLRVIASGSAAGRGDAERGPASSRGALDLAALRALTECSELASAVPGLTGPDGGPLPAGPAGELAREAASEATREIMDMALAEMLFALGYAIQPFGTSGVWMATGRRAEQEA